MIRPSGTTAYIVPTGIGLNSYNYLCQLTGGSIGSVIGNRAQSSIGWADTGIYFGNGNTPVTVNDYRLAGETIQNLKGIISTTSLLDDEFSPGVTMHITLTNNNSNSVTISEIGLFGGNSSGFTSSTGSSSGVFMYERTVLDEPITIEAGGVGKIDYTLRINYPTT